MSKTEGVYESRSDLQSPPEIRQYYLDAIDAADQEEKSWRDGAKKAWSIYTNETPTSFNILASNTDTIVPAIFNSLPIPDIRTRFSDRNEVARRGAQVLERAISYELDEYDAQEIADKAVKDFVITGRGIVRVRYDPTIGRKPVLDGAGQPLVGKDGKPVETEYVVWETVRCEYVPYDRYRRGPGTSWDQVEWVAFEKFLTRDELVELAGAEIGTKVALDASTDGKDEGSRREKDVFRCARVWEVWDKSRRKVLYISAGFDGGPIAVLDDPLRLGGFFPFPRPLQVGFLPGTMVPIVPYQTYEKQAAELGRISDRILKLVGMAKYRGVRASELQELDSLTSLEDGQFMPSTEAMAILQNNGDLARAIWAMPLSEIISVIQTLVQQREIIKATIFEQMGIADIMRGATKANETYGAQRMKAQWGSIRVQIMQNEVQRYWRDLFRIKAEIIAEHFQPDTLMAISGETASDPEGQKVFQDVMGLLKRDIQRRYMIDIETDSTIQADRTRDRGELTEFLRATGEFMQVAIGASQTGMVPPAVMVAMYQSIASKYKLGKQVDDELAKLAVGAVPMAKQQQEQKQREKQQAEEARELNKQSVMMDLQQKQIGLQRSQVDLQRQVVDIQKEGEEIVGQQIENRNAAMGIPSGPGFVAG